MRRTVTKLGMFVTVWTLHIREYILGSLLKIKVLSSKEFLDYLNNCAFACKMKNNCLVSYVTDRSIIKSKTNDINIEQILRILKLLFT